jgi:hypothetical protein
MLLENVHQAQFAKNRKIEAQLADNVQVRLCEVIYGKYPTTDLQWWLGINADQLVGPLVLLIIPFLAPNNVQTPEQREKKEN